LLAVVGGSAFSCGAACQCPVAWSLASAGDGAIYCSSRRTTADLGGIALSVALPLTGIGRAGDSFSIDGGQLDAQLSGSMQPPTGFGPGYFAGGLIACFCDCIAVHNYISGYGAFPGFPGLCCCGAKLRAHSDCHLGSC